MTVAPDPFHLQVLAVSEDAVRLAVTGELDIATAPQLDEAIEREMAAHRDVTLDLSSLTFIDSTGILSLVHAINAAKVNGWSFSIAASLPANVQRVVEVTGLAPVLPLVEE